MFNKCLLSVSYYICVYIYIYIYIKDLNYLWISLCFCASCLPPSGSFPEWEDDDDESSHGGYDRKQLLFPEFVRSHNIGQSV